MYQHSSICKNTVSGQADLRVGTMYEVGIDFANAGLCAGSSSPCSSRLPLPGMQGCGPTAPSAASPVIVALGDSLTSGPGLRPDETYPALLQQRIAGEREDYRVLNAGVTGDTSSDALLRFDAALVPGTKIVILAIGGNDGLRRVPVATVERNISTMIERAQARGVDVLLCQMEAPPLGGLSYTHRVSSYLHAACRAVQGAARAILSPGHPRKRRTGSRRHAPPERCRPQGDCGRHLALLAPDALGALLSSPTGGDL